MTTTFKIQDGDIVFDEATGRPIELEDKEKLRQDIRENFETTVQADGTGADLDGLIAYLGDAFSIRAELNRRLQESFNALKNIQSLVQRSDRTSAEQIDYIVSVQVMPIRDASSGTFKNTEYAYRIDIKSKASGPGLGQSQQLTTNGAIVSLTGVIAG